MATQKNHPALDALRKSGAQKVKVACSDIDGVLQATVDTFASSLQARRIVFTATGLSAGAHTLRIEVVGTSNRPRIDVDGVIVLAL